MNTTYIRVIIDHNFSSFNCDTTNTQIFSRKCVITPRVSIQVTRHKSYNTSGSHSVSQSEYKTLYQHMPNYKPLSRYEHFYVRTCP